MPNRRVDLLPIEVVHESFHGVLGSNLHHFENCLRAASNLHLQLTKRQHCDKTVSGSDQVGLVVLVDGEICSKHVAGHVADGKRLDNLLVDLYKNFAVDKYAQEIDWLALSRNLVIPLLSESRSAYFLKLRILKREEISSTSAELKPSNMLVGDSSRSTSKMRLN